MKKLFVVISNGKYGHGIFEAEDEVDAIEVCAKAEGFKNSLDAYGTLPRLGGPIAYEVMPNKCYYYDEKYGIFVRVGDGVVTLTIKAFDEEKSIMATPDNVAIKIQDAIVAHMKLCDRDEDYDTLKELQTKYKKLEKRYQWFRHVEIATKKPALVKDGHVYGNLEHEGVEVNIKNGHVIIEYCNTIPSRAAATEKHVKEFILDAIRTRISWAALDNNLSLINQLTEEYQQVTKNTISSVTPLNQEATKRLGFLMETILRP